MNYRIIISKHALKELEELPKKINQLISESINKLSDNPRPIGCKKIVGKKEYLWRIRVGDYRIIYSIEDSIKVVEIRKIGNRKDIYK